MIANAAPITNQVMALGPNIAKLLGMLLNPKTATKIIDAMVHVEISFFIFSPFLNVFLNKKPAHCAG